MDKAVRNVTLLESRSATVTPTSVRPSPAEPTSHHLASHRWPMLLQPDNVWFVLQTTLLHTLASLNLIHFQFNSVHILLFP
jgi:hypothetical protein